MKRASAHTLLHMLASGALVGLLMVAAASAAPSEAAAEEAIVGAASVVDGDTIEIRGKRIRLNGIDAPEGPQECLRPDGTRWRCGQEAAFALSDRIGRATVRCEVHGRDRYRRAIATCFKGTEDLNRWMVAAGWAVAYRKYSLDYVREEESAQSAHLRIWSGTFDMPWDWRQMSR